MPRLTAKLIKMKLKYGWCIKDFTDYLNMSEEDFIIALQKQFSQSACNDMLMQLNKNDKRQRKLSSHQNQATVKKSSQVKEEFNEKTSYNLEDLLAQEKKILDEICQKEASHAGIISERKSIRASLRKEKAEILELQKIFKKHEESIKSLIDRLEITSSNLTSINLELSDSNSELEKIRFQIESLKKVSIYVYGDGNIEVENGKLVVSDTWEELFKNLTADISVENLTLKQIRQLAKLLVFVDYLRKQNKDFDISFESQNLQDAFSHFCS